ncbi:MAG TPA: TetR/AcrR family transcriptional regulator [Acetobacteraceae bacterium]|nr:TetR/AcrR family transcriptional regulator [Acetobacteraceae bacterium]
MSRPRQIADDVVLDRAINVFWRHGYAAASMRDLTLATGLSAASLYHRYRDKDGLFAAAINRYADLGISARLARLTREPDPIAAIKNFFNEIISLSDDDPHHLGCLLVNSLLDGGAMSAQARALVHSRLFEVQGFLKTQIARARKSSALPDHINPAAMAEYLTATILSLRVLARIDANPKQLRRIADQALNALGCKK